MKKIQSGKRNDVRARFNYNNSHAYEATKCSANKPRCSSIRQWKKNEAKYTTNAEEEKMQTN